MSAAPAPGAAKTNRRKGPNYRRNIISNYSRNLLIGRVLILGVAGRLNPTYTSVVFSFGHARSRNLHGRSVLTPAKSFMR